jgi:rare lipoprotein A
VSGRGGAARLALLVTLLAVSACGHGPRRSLADAPGEVAATLEEGLASFYADSLQGHATASGRPYDREAFTCAHRTWPFGTRLLVTEPVGGRRVVVTVTDRGPWVAGRVVDLSRAAARALGLAERGVIRVRVERAP